MSFGTYTLIYEKSGFGTFKKFDLEHTNTGSSTSIPETPSLALTSTTQINDLTVTVNRNDVTLSVSTDPADNIGDARYIRYFLSTNSNVDNEKYTYFFPG